MGKGNVTIHWTRSKDSKLGVAAHKFENRYTLSAGEVETLKIYVEAWIRDSLFIFLPGEREHLIMLLHKVQVADQLREYCRGELLNMGLDPF